MSDVAAFWIALGLAFMGYFIGCGLSEIRSKK